MAQLLGYTSGFLWLCSSAAWLWSAYTPIPVTRSPSSSDFEGIALVSGEPGNGGGMFINGMRPPSANEFFEYQRKVLFRNFFAAATSAAAAICACGAVYLSVQCDLISPALANQ